MARIISLPEPDLVLVQMDVVPGKVPFISYSKIKSC